MLAGDAALPGVGALPSTPVSGAATSDNSAMIDGVAMRMAARSDLEAIISLAGCQDRAEARLQAAERGDDSMVVAVLHSEVVGVASVRWRHGCDEPHPWLYGLHVARACRRQGIGRLLVGAAETLAGRHGAGCLSLDVGTDDDVAGAFYAALGYTVVRPHQHRWRSTDATGTVLAQGTVPTLILRRQLLN